MSSVSRLSKTPRTKPGCADSGETAMPPGRLRRLATRPRLPWRRFAAGGMRWASRSIRGPAGCCRPEQPHFTLCVRTALQLSTFSAQNSVPRSVMNSPTKRSSFAVAGHCPNTLFNATPHAQREKAKRNSDGTPCVHLGIQDVFTRNPSLVLVAAERTTPRN